MAVTAYQGKRIRALRQRGVGYRTIAAELGISRDAVRNFCTTHDLSGVAAVQPPPVGNECPCCGGEIIALTSTGAPSGGATTSMKVIIDVQRRM